MADSDNLFTPQNFDELGKRIEVLINTITGD
jgi:hypothetical protein